MGSHLSVTEIYKVFSGMTVLSGVSLAVKGGEIHGLLGANGAGKSTLVKILSGVLKQDRGRIRINGNDVSFNSPLEAKKAGIITVHQEVDAALVPSLSVAENIFLSRFAGGERGAWIHMNRLYREAEDFITRFGFSLPVRKKAGELRLPEKQILLITRAMAEKARFILLDEPTAPLSTHEADVLFQLMDRLKKEGIGIMFISHRLNEVFRCCDRMTVMRDGKAVSTRNAGETNISQVIQEMLGNRPAKGIWGSEIHTEKRREKGSLLLQAIQLKRGRKVNGINLKLHRGEIVGVVGLVGAGKTELARILFGADRWDEGEIFLKGKRIRLHTPRDAVQAGMAFVPEERRKEGLLIHESVTTNVSLPVLRRLSTMGLIRYREEKRLAHTLIQKLGIKVTDPGQVVGALSGGNQQKVVVGKWLVTEADIYLFDEPTKGIDIGAKYELFQVIRQLALEGKGILYFSGEIDEVLGMADRILVMYDGRLVKELFPDETTEEEILFYASGGGIQDEGKSARLGV